VLIPAVENAISGDAFRPGDVLRSRKGPAPRPIGAAAEIALVVGFATLAVGHLTTALAPGAMRALLDDPDRVAVIETIGLIGALLFAWGVAERLRRRVQALRAGVAEQGPRVIVLGILLAVCLSGVFLTVGYRWITVWYAYISVPYVRSLIAMEPMIDSIVASPFPIKLHAMLFMALVASWPMAGVPFDEIFPLRAVARRLADSDDGAGGHDGVDDARGKPAAPEVPS